MDLTEDDERLISLLAQKVGSTRLKSLLWELKAIPEDGKAAHFLRNLLQTVPMFAGYDRTRKEKHRVTFEDARLDELIGSEDYEPVLKEIASFEHQLEHLPVDSDLRHCLSDYIQELRDTMARWKMRNR